MIDQHLGQRSTEIGFTYAWNTGGAEGPRPGKVAKMATAPGGTGEG